MLGENACHRLRVERILREPYQPFLLLEMSGHHGMPMSLDGSHRRGHRDRTGHRVALIFIGRTPCSTRHYQRSMMLTRQRKQSANPGHSIDNGEMNHNKVV